MFYLLPLRSTIQEPRIETSNGTGGWQKHNQLPALALINQKANVFAMNFINGVITNFSFLLYTSTKMVCNKFTAEGASIRHQLAVDWTTHQRSTTSGQVWGDRDNCFIFGKGKSNSNK
jgi:hypothetical protein